MFEYGLLALLLFLQAVLRMARMTSIRKPKNIFWFYQPLIFPLLFSLGLLLQYLGIDVIAYLAILGLLFEFICFFLRRRLFDQR